MARYIDADKLHYSRVRIVHPDGTIGGYHAVVMSAEIKGAPTADVVEVVRCGKCKYGDVGVFSKTKDGQEDIACYCNLKKKVTDIDWYCPNGERRDASRG